jgi:mRNA-degrading endonuclease toxin of MazEF toxin-antitoxin module
MADQITTISKLRLQRHLGRLSNEDMAVVGRVVCLHLGL